MGLGSLSHGGNGVFPGAEETGVKVYHTSCLTIFTI